MVIWSLPLARCPLQRASSTFAYGAGKSRTAAILLSGLLALDKEERCHFQVICTENTGTRSFANMLLYLEVPTDLRLRIGRFVADSEANKSESGTYFDIFHSSKRERVQLQDSESSLKESMDPLMAKAVAGKRILLFEGFFCSQANWFM